MADLWRYALWKRGLKVVRSKTNYKLQEPEVVKLDEF